MGRPQAAHHPTQHLTTMSKCESERIPKNSLIGKILRGTIKSITNDMAYKVPSTIEDMDTLEEIN